MLKIYKSNDLKKSMRRTIALKFSFMLLVVVSMQMISFVGYAQTEKHTVSGTVTSSDDKAPVIGANVVIKGSTAGTITDVNGNYSLSVSEGDVLLFSFIGYLSEEVVVGSQTTINVELSEDITTLGEVVVIGYGTVKKSDLTGAVSSVKGDDLRGSVTANVDQALQGRVAGVQVTQNSGAPGAVASIRVRGTTSLTSSNEPLYVIDGIQVGGNASGITGFDWQGGSGGQQSNTVSPLAAINPNDIESIEVLKDASATAIYGSRAANGVVIVTTKRGKKGEAKISYNGLYGIQQVYKTFDMMDLKAYAEYNNEVADEVSTINANDRFRDPSILGSGTDWQEAIFQVAPMQSHTLSISGGDEGVRYLVSGGYFDQEGVVIGSDFNRVSLRANIDSKVKDWVSIGTSLSLSRKDEKITLQDGGDGVISQAAQMAPHIPVKNFDGTYAGPDPAANEGSAQIGANPVALALLRNNTVLENRILSSFYADFKILEELKFKSEIAVDYRNVMNKAFQPSYEWGSIVNLTSKLGQASNQSFYWEWKNFATYTKKFGSHNIVGMAGYEARKSQWDNFTAYKANLPNDIPVMNQGEESGTLNTGSKGWSSMASVFARVNYDFDGKYLVTATIRRDGSSRFGSENRWGWFPSTSIAWKINEENFMQQFSLVSNLKLRLGWGLVGNQEIRDGAFVSSLQTVNTYFGSGVINNAYSNPVVKWESTEQYNFGLDLGMFDDRISLSVDGYIKETDNLLLEVNLPKIFGTQVNGPQANIGSMSNKGIEFSLNTVNIDKNKFKWSTNLNVSHNCNEVKDIGGVTIFNNLYWYTGFQTATITTTGHPVGQFYGYVMEGIFTSKQEILDHAVQIPSDGDANVNKIERTTGVWLGDIKWKDLNGDGVINTDDQTFIGDPNPDITFGFNNTFSYGPLTLDLYMLGAIGGDILNYSRARNEQMISNFDNQLVTVQNRARTRLIEGGTDINNIDHVELIDPNTDIPRFDNGGENFNHYMSTRWIEDGTYLRIQNIKLAYNLPESLLQKAHISSAQMYVNVQNVVTFSDYSGLDPQVGAFNQNALMQNIDMGRYPSPRVFTLGVNIDF